METGNAEPRLREGERTMALAIEYLWRDRKRHLGLPISFTRYGLSEDRLFLSTGLLNTHDDEILLYRVRDISVRRSLVQRLFGVGTIEVLSTDKAMPDLHLKNIRHPREVKELLHAQVEDMKLHRRVRVGEIMSDTDIRREEDDEFDHEFY